MRWDTNSPTSRFRYLGAFGFQDGQRWTSIGATEQRALLVLDANRVVSAGKLISELWADRFHAGARTLLAGYVWSYDIFWVKTTRRRSSSARVVTS